MMESFNGILQAKRDAVVYGRAHAGAYPATTIAVASGGGILPFFTRRLPRWKRMLDITGSLFFMALLWPLFMAIAAAIKIASPGPVFFKQKRIGCGGQSFEFIKFRTMDNGCDVTKHRQYLSDLIGGCQNGREESAPMAKLDHCNPAIFPFGRFLRKTCLDELPQLINVLRGEMSLVGPRPPIPYEVAEYGGWHNGRFDAVPGMTGLWQVSGKNRLSFKEMVRLDIRYSQNLTLLQDLKILLMTPFAILSELTRPSNPRSEVIKEMSR